jgi:drug/metabolite transporter (DMT)-like permease
MAVAGATVLALHSGSLHARAVEGDALALLSAATLAAYYAAVTQASRGCSAWTVLAAISLLTALILFAVAMLSEPVLQPSSFHGWAALGLLALLGQAIGQACLAQASRCLGAIGVSTMTLAEPALAAVFALALIGSPLMPPHVAGLALITAGLWFSQRRNLATN